MKTSTEICSASRIIGEERAVELCAKAGFDGWDFSMFDMVKFDWNKGCFIESNHPLGSKDYAKFAKQLRKIGEDNGIKCNQSHAPFPTAPIDKDYLKRAIECTAIAGGEICIIHPDNNASAEKNAELYNALLPFAKEHNVKIATENMWNWANGANKSSPAACSSAKDFKKHIDVINDPYFVACLDLGHAEMEGSGDGAPYMIRELGDRLQALHIHDNDRLHDSHQIPFSMSMDFNEIAKALKDINYSGYLTLEADRYLADGGFNSENILDGLKNLANSAKRLDEIIKAI